ncbi:MAG: zinc metalloprotease HtpX [Gammaproteobacteria bacterium]|jgi:heat shock protein HtpX
MNQKNYMQFKAADWRATLAENQRKTFGVIAVFMLIYIIVGLIVDMYIHGGFIAGNFGRVFVALVSFQVTPWATITMLIVAAISLLVTFALHDRLMLLGTNSREITPKTAQNLAEQQLYNVVEEMKIAAGMRYMPKVYLIEADYMNAFASGYSEKSALIAITRGLLQKLDRDELAAVMAHELSHIRHGDIKLTLTASVLSSLMLIVVDILFYNVIFGGSRRRQGGDNRFLMIIILLRYLLPVITVLLMLFLSRTREYMADAGSVELMRDNTPLGRALLKINQDHQDNLDTYKQEYGQTKHEDIRRAAYIFDPISIKADPIVSFTSLFSTHPSIPSRLRKLGFRKQ